jgi:hypothetical protein
VDARAVPATPTGPLDGAPDVPVSPACDNGSNYGVQQSYDRAGNYLYDVWSGCGGVGFAWSADGGATFSNASALPVCGSDPSVAAAPNGTVYVAYISNCSSQGPSPYVIASGDHGLTFSSPVRVLPNGTNGSMSRDRLAVTANGTPELLWIDSDNRSLDRSVCPPVLDCYYTYGDFDARFSRSLDGGRHWSPNASANSRNATMDTLSASMVVAPDGSTDLLLEEYSVIGSSERIGDGGFFFARAPNGSASFSDATPVTSLPAPARDGEPDGAIGVDASGTLYAAFDATSGGTDAAYVALSRDSGSTWAAPLLLDRSPDGSLRMLPSVSGGGDGLAQLAWLSNDSGGGAWAVEGASVWANGTHVGSPFTISNGTGPVGSMAGTTLSLVELGHGVASAAWSFLDPPEPPASGATLQVFENVEAEPLPSAPAIVRVTTGPGTILVRWTMPAPTAPWTGFELGWGHDRPGWQVSAGPTADNATGTGLVPEVVFLVAVRAVNDAGNGPASPYGRVNLSAWSIVEGTILPSEANLTLDSAAVPVVGGAYRVNTTVGAHLLNATSTGYQPMPRSFSAPWNGTTWENFTLVRDNGSVSGYLAPSNGTLTWDGAAVALRAGGFFSIVGVAGSAHVLSARAAGYHSQSLDVTLPDRIVLWENVTLSPVYGELVLQVLPHAATVTVNGTAVRINQTGGARLSLYPGTYRVSASEPNYVTTTVTATVVAGAVARVALNLSLAPPNPTSPSVNYGALELVSVGVGLLVVAVVVGLYLWRRRLPPSGPPRRPPGSEELYGDDPESAPAAPQLSDGAPPSEPLPEAPDQ